MLYLSFPSKIPYFLTLFPTSKIRSENKVLPYCSRPLSWTSSHVQNHRVLGSRHEATRGRAQFRSSVAVHGRLYSFACRWLNPLADHEEFLNGKYTPPEVPFHPDSFFHTNDVLDCTVVALHQTLSLGLGQGIKLSKYPPEPKQHICIGHPMKSDRQKFSEGIHRLVNWMNMLKA